MLDSFFCLLSFGSLVIQKIVYFVGVVVGIHHDYGSALIGW